MNQLYLTKLLSLLDKAENLVSKFRGGYSGQFSSAEEFHHTLRKSISSLKEGDYSQLDRLNIWFLPTSCWDDFTGIEGQELGNQISEHLSASTDK